MTVPELARLCAEAIARETASPSRQGTLAEIAEPLIRGAITRALEEAGQQRVEHVHTDRPGLGGVDVKITKSTQGVALEVDVKRPREAPESWSEATDASALLAAVAYARTAEQLAKIGLTPGREAKP